MQVLKKDIYKFSNRQETGRIFRSGKNREKFKVASFLGSSGACSLRRDLFKFSKAEGIFKSVMVNIFYYGWFILCQHLDLPTSIIIIVDTMTLSRFLGYLISNHRSNIIMQYRQRNDKYLVHCRCIVEELVIHYNNF